MSDGPTAPGLLGKFRRPYSLLWKNRRQVIIGTICVPISALLVLSMPIVLGRAIDRLGQPSGDDAVDSAALLASCLLFAGIALGDAIARFVARHQIINASRQMEARLKGQLMEHIGRLPIAWFDRARTGDLISRLTQDVELLRFVTGPGILYGGQALVTVPGGIYLMLSLSPIVAAAALCAFVGMLLGMRLLMPKLQRTSQEVQRSIAAISQRGAEGFAGVRVLLAFGRARHETEAMRSLCQDYLGHNMQLARLRAWVNLLIHSMRDGVVLAVVVLGAIEAIAGRMTIGELLQFLGLLGAMVWPLLATGWVLSTFHRAVAAAERVEEIFALDPEPAGGETPSLRGAIRVTGLTFRYEGQDQPALHDVSFELAPNQKLGVVGPVGSGKSTLLALLLRLYDPPAGTVFVDGFDVLDLDPRVLRSTFSFAPQDPFLFSDTIEGNIEFGRIDGDASVTEAVHAASLERDIDELEHGIETVVGERGVTLSGGQKQRVSLARALAAQREALVLDDTLSAVDHATEGRILSRLEQHHGDQTLLVAAHRLSSVRDADLILVLDAGRVVQQGTHEALLAAGGFYADTWRRQSEHRALEQEGE